MSTPARRSRTNSYGSFLGEDSAAPAAGSFAHGGKGTKTPFFRPLRLELPFGGQNLSSLRPSFRATGPWRGKCLGLPLPPGPPGSCHVVWPTINGGPMRHRPLPTDDSFCVGADVSIRPRQLPNFYGCWHQARFPGPAGWFSQVIQPAAAARKREQSTAPPAPASRNYPREASLVTGACPGDSQGELPQRGKRGWPGPLVPF